MYQLIARVEKIEFTLNEVLTNLKLIHKQNEKIMGQNDQIQQDVATITTALATISADITSIATQLATLKGNSTDPATVSALDALAQQATSAAAALDAITNPPAAIV